MNLQGLLNSPQGSVVGHSFSQLITGFLTDLKETFPEHESLDLCLRGLQVANEADPMAALKGWIKSMEVLVAAGHEQPFFTECTEEKITAFLGLIDKMHPILRLIPLDSMWNDEGLVNEDREAIWSHLQQLELSAMTINAFDPSAISAIEGLAKRYMGQLQNMDPSQVDIKTLGFDVIRQVMNDPDIKKALADPNAEKRFASTFGKDGEKFAKIASGNGGGSAGLSAMLGNIQSSMGGDVNPAALMQNLMAQASPAAAAAGGAGGPGVGAGAGDAQAQAQAMALMQQLGIDPQMAAQLFQDARFQ